MCRKLICSVSLVLVLGTILTSVTQAELVGWWRLDDGSGTTAVDSSGNGNDGTLRGDPHWVAGAVDGALYFDGDDDVEVTMASSALKSASLTVAAWVKADPSTSGESWVVGQGDNYGLVVNRYNDDSIFFYFYDGAGWPAVGSGDVGILDGQWHHISGVFDDGTDTLYVYKDGVRVGMESATGTIVYSIGDEFTIGSMMSQRNYMGAIDDVRVYNHVLSQAEMDVVALATSSLQDGRTALAEIVHEHIPSGVTFHKNTIYRPDGHGDNWRPLWAADDSQITPMCDGSWLGIKQYHNHLYRIIGGPDNFLRKDIPNYPDFSPKLGSWFGYGVVSVDGILYSVVSKTPGPRWSGPFRGIKLLKSKDNGDTWYRVDRHGNERKLGSQDSARNEVNPHEMFFLEEFGLPHQKQKAYPFSFVDFVKCGKDNSAAKDNYLYIYAPEGAHAHKLLLARVPKDKLGIRSVWEYFVKYKDSLPIWTSDISKRGHVHVYPQKSRDGNCFGWYSWVPSVVWNEGLGFYIMVNGGTYGGSKMTSSDKDYYSSWMHTQTGSLGFWHSKKPYGPWHQFYYTDYWTVDDPKNRTYQPSLSPKWISKDGKEMVLIWSDAMKNKEGRSHTVNYKWNHMRITIQTK